MDRACHFQPAAGWLNGAQLARVVDLSDPERRNRVQVRLLAFDGVEGQDAPLWARVVCPFAGADRGAFLMPDERKSLAADLRQRLSDLRTQRTP